VNVFPKKGDSRERVSRKRAKRSPLARHTKHLHENNFRNYTRVFLFPFLLPTLSQEARYSQKLKVWACGPCLRIGD